MLRRSADPKHNIWFLGLNICKKSLLDSDRAYNNLKQGWNRHEFKCLKMTYVLIFFIMIVPDFCRFVFHVIFKLPEIVIFSPDVVRNEEDAGIYFLHNLIILVPLCEKKTSFIYCFSQISGPIWAFNFIITFFFMYRTTLNVLLICSQTYWQCVYLHNPSHNNRSVVFGSSRLVRWRCNLRCLVRACG